MRVPHLVGQVMVTFLIAAAVVPLVVVLMPAARDARIGYLSLVVALVIVFAILRVVWPRPRS